MLMNVFINQIYLDSSLLPTHSQTKDMCSQLTRYIVIIIDMTDYINSLFSKKSYVLMFLTLPLVFPFLGFYLSFKIWQINPDSDLSNIIFIIKLN